MPEKSTKSPISHSISTVPSHIFQNRSFSILETLVVYLKEECGLRYRQIGDLLNRNERTIWTCYHRSQQKKKKTVEAHPSSINIPLGIFRFRDVSFSESLVHYLKDHLGMTYHEIGVLLNRDDRTIWTLVDRYHTKKVEVKNG